MRLDATGPEEGRRLLELIVFDEWETLDQRRARREKVDGRFESRRGGPHASLVRLDGADPKEHTEERAAANADPGDDGGARLTIKAALRRRQVAGARAAGSAFYTGRPPFAPL